MQVNMSCINFLKKNSTCIKFGDEIIIPCVYIDAMHQANLILEGDFES